MSESVSATAGLTVYVLMINDRPTTLIEIHLIDLGLLLTFDTPSLDVVASWIMLLWDLCKMALAVEEAHCSELDVCAWRNSKRQIRMQCVDKVAEHIMRMVFYQLCCLLSIVKLRNHTLSTTTALAR